MQHKPTNHRLKRTGKALCFINTHILILYDSGKELWHKARVCVFIDTKSTRTHGRTSQHGKEKSNKNRPIQTNYTHQMLCDTSSFPSLFLSVYFTRLIFRFLSIVAFLQCLHVCKCAFYCLDFPKKNKISSKVFRVISNNQHKHTHRDTHANKNLFKHFFLLQG